nr:PREDICTED: uncharacterized protein LOC105676576 [Linepithema humile]
MELMRSRPRQILQQVEQIIIHLLVYLAEEVQQIGILSELGMSVLVITFDPEAPTYDPPMSPSKTLAFRLSTSASTGPRSKLPKSMTKSWLISMPNICAFENKI